MSEGETAPSGARAGKIVLIVVAVLVGLGILCCGGGFLLVGDKVTAMWQFGKASTELATGLQKEFGQGTSMNFIQDEEGMVFVVGIPGGAKPEEVPALQDRAWKVYCEAFQDGGLPIVGLAVGTGTKAGGNLVRRWRKNIVSVEEIAARTGVAAPGPSKLFEGLDQNELKVQTPGEDDDPEDGGDAEPDGESGGDAAPEGESDGGTESK